MAYESVDRLQKALVKDVFHYAKDSKKAAGRALGTIVEIITYYLIKTWGLNNQISIERGLEEYGNPDITHNVEFSLHPIVRSSFLTIDKTDKSITASKILKALEEQKYNLKGFEIKSNQLLNNGVLRNACTIATSNNSFLLCSIKADKGDKFELHIYEQSRKLYSVFECKRVGVEEGMSKGPQTIEKAKQGAYVARSASSLQKIRTESGELHGIIYKSDGSYIIKPFVDLMEEIIYSNDKELLRRFIVTVGVVSNHGNWFTSENQNKELKVLAQSYDWLLFLTDNGLAEFIEKLLFKPTKEFAPIRKAFISSYTATKKKNQFTKVQMNIEADRLLLEYFSKNIKTIESWFNVISPKKKSLATLKDELKELKNKDWTNILQ
ncbi:MAG: hypothetical protein EPN85_07245 [Bacteroidetes bacterium]|nr:MAG: hypothetical protein EPN85_07245 [Bacteroidota bacterium]